MLSRILVICGLGITAAPVAAQDIPSPYEGALAEQGQRQMMDTLARRRWQQAQQRRHGRRAIALSPKARATCLNKARAARNFGRSDPKVRRVCALCAQAGY